MGKDNDIESIRLQLVRTMRMLKHIMSIMGWNKGDIVKKISLIGVLCFSIVLSACGGKDAASESAGSPSKETEIELQAYDKEEHEEKKENTIANDIGYQKMYAREDSIESARNIVLSIPDQLSEEDVKGGDYIKAMFQDGSIQIELFNNKDEILARGYCNPENQSSHFWYHFPVDTNELYDENDRLYMRSDGFDSIIYKYDEQDRVVEEEIVYNYFHSDSLAESIMDSIETNEEDYAYIDDVSDAVYGMEDILYDYVEPDYERIRYEYDDSGNCIKKLSYGGPEDDTLNWDCSYTYEGDKLVRESENDGREYTDYEYDGDTLVKESKYRNDSLYSTKKYYYDPEKKTKMILEEFTDPESENELTGIIYLNK